MRYSDGYGMSGLGYTEQEIKLKLRQDGDYCRYKNPCAPGECTVISYQGDMMTAKQPMCGCKKCNSDFDLRSACPSGTTLRCYGSGYGKTCVCESRFISAPRTVKMISSMFRM